MRSFVAFAILFPAVCAFAPLQTSTRRVAPAATCLYYSRLDLIDKEFQLEEREDKDSSVTDVWLRADGSVDLRQTDGPPLESFKGSWMVNEDLKGDAKGENAFKMTLVRQFAGGTHTGANQAGEFMYNVKREFWGDISKTGDVISVSGTIHGEDEAKKVDCEVGYFALIDENN